MKLCVHVELLVLKIPAKFHVWGITGRGVICEKGATHKHTFAKKSCLFSTFLIWRFLIW